MRSGNPPPRSSRDARPRWKSAMPQSRARLEAAHRGEGVRARHVGAAREIGKAMAAKYDLSEETAKARSVGVKGFKAHKLLDAKGYAKLGGMQRDGSVAVDRYISYRRGKDIVSLGVFLLKDQPVEAHEFHVIAPRPCSMAQSRSPRFARPRPKRRSSPPIAGLPSRICRARPPRSMRRWRRSRPDISSSGVIAMQATSFAQRSNPASP